MDIIKTIRQEIEQHRKKFEYEGSMPNETAWKCLGELLSFLDTLQEPAKRGYKDCNGCEYNRTLKDQIGWQFQGCFGGDYKGKPIAEIELCPLKVAALQELEVDLEKEVEKYFQGLWPGMETAEQCNTDMHFTPPAIMRLVSHFYNLGKNAK